MRTGLTLLVDSASLIYRALFSVPDTVRAPDGTLVNAAYGFLGMLESLVAQHDPDFICCAADDDWRPEWRVELIDTYKTHRAQPGSAQEQAEDLLAPQVPVIFEILAGCGIPVVGHPGYEAEDVIGTLAERAPGRVAIVSGDRDLFQLVRDPDIVVLYPRRGVSQVDVVNEAYIQTKYQIPGRAYRDFALLRGDPSDGLPGVRGVGEKLAAGLLARYGSLDGILQPARGSDPQGTALSKVRRDLDYVERALKVVTIPTDLPIPDVDLTRPRREPDATVVSLAERYGLGGAVRRLVAALSRPGTVVPEGTNRG
jgi:5'-3' exonuclease